MSLYHCHSSIIGGGSVRSAVASSAYRSGTVLQDEKTGQTWDFTRKGGVEYSEVILPDNAPREWENREVLWNEVQKAEKGNNPRYAREFEFALQKELTLEQNIDLAKDIINTYMVNKGMCADMAIHNKENGKENIHCHVMCTTRPIDENGKWESKTQKVYLCKNQAGEEKGFTNEEFKKAGGEWEKQYHYSKAGNPKGKKVWLTKYQKENDEKYKDYERIKNDRNPKTERYGRQNPKSEYWNSDSFINEVREGIAKKTNETFVKLGNTERVDHRSYKEQGIEKIPTIHEGYASRAREQAGQISDKCAFNREVKAINKAHDKTMGHYYAKLLAIKNTLIQERRNIYELYRDWSENRKEIYGEKLRTYERAVVGIDKGTGRNHAEAGRVHREFRSGFDVLREIRSRITGFMQQFEPRKQETDRIIQGTRERLHTEDTIIQKHYANIVSSYTYEEPKKPLKTEYTKPQEHTPVTPVNVKHEVPKKEPVQHIHEQTGGKHDMNYWKAEISKLRSERAEKNHITLPAYIKTKQKNVEAKRQDVDRLERDYKEKAIHLDKLNARVDVIISNDKKREQAECDLRDKRKELVEFENMPMLKQIMQRDKEKEIKKDIAELTEKIEHFKKAVSTPENKIILNEWIESRDEKNKAKDMWSTAKEELQSMENDLRNDKDKFYKTHTSYKENEHENENEYEDDFELE